MIGQIARIAMDVRLPLLFLPETDLFTIISTLFKNEYKINMGH